MALITFERVALCVANVTAEQVDKCHKIYDLQHDETAFYMVENEGGEMDTEGRLIEYPVRYDPKRGFTCGCKSGEHGFAGVRHPSGTCKHVRWSVAAELEERGTLAAQQQEEPTPQHEEERTEAATTTEPTPQQEATTDHQEEESAAPTATAERPDWYNPENRTSYLTRTRAALLLDEVGREVSDGEYYRRTLETPQGRTDPLPSHFMR